MKDSQQQKASSSSSMHTINYRIIKSVGVRMWFRPVDESARARSLTIALDRHSKFGPRIKFELGSPDHRMPYSDKQYVSFKPLLDVMTIHAIPLPQVSEILTLIRKIQADRGAPFFDGVRKLMELTIKPELVGSTSPIDPKIKPRPYVRILDSGELDMVGPGLKPQLFRMPPTVVTVVDDNPEIEDSVFTDPIDEDIEND